MSDELNNIIRNNDPDFEKEIYDILVYEIAVELFQQDNIDFTEESLKAILAKCNNNPWDAIIVGNIMKLAEENMKNSK